MARKRHKSPHCLNCGAPLRGRYCYECGQENLDHQESVWHLFRHFFEDLTHYDGKLWKTAKPLLVRPGFLTQEYLRGKRASYLNPVRMFIFLNFIFFLFWFSLPERETKSSTETEEASVPINLNLSPDAGKAEKEDSAEIDSIIKLKLGPKTNLTLPGVTFRTLREYDSAQAAMPVADRDGYVTRKLRRRAFEVQKEILKNPEFFKDKFLETFRHNIPKLNFLFLFFCSIFLYLVYWRKHLYMVNHAIFAIHLACTFLLLSVIMLLFTYLPYGLWLSFALVLYENYYFYRALRNVYEQPRGKTILKFLIINFLLVIAMLGGLLINILYAALSQKG